MQKKLFILSICFSVLALLSGCATEASGKSLPKKVSDAVATTITEVFTEITSEDITENDEEKTITDLYEEIVAQDKLKTLSILTDDYIENYYNIDTTKLKDFVFAQAADPTSSDTLILIKVKDMAYIEEIVAGVQGIIEQKKIEFNNYLPQQYNKVVAGQIVVEEDFIYLIIADKPDEIVIG